MNIYETTFARSKFMDIQSIRKDLEKMSILGDEIVQPTEFEGVYQLAPSEDRIRVFDFPLLFINDKEEAVCFDSRQYMNPKGTVRDPVDYRTIKQLSILELQWATNRDVFQPILESASVVYGHWMARILGGRYNLEPQVSEYIRIAMTALYLSYQYDAEDAKRIYAEGRGELFLSKQLQRAGKNLPPMIQELLDRPAIDNAGTLLETLQVTTTSRFSYMLNWISKQFDMEALGITATSMMNMVSAGSWVGFKATPFAVTALEHPPVLIMLINRTLNYSFFERTQIGQAVRMSAKKTNLDGIKRWLANLSAGTERMEDLPIVQDEEGGAVAESDIMPDESEGDQTVNGLI